MPTGGSPGRRADGLIWDSSPVAAAPCHAVWDIAIFHQYDTAPTLGAGSWVASPAFAPTANVFRAGPWGPIITAVVRLVREHAPGQPATESGCRAAERCLVGAHGCTPSGPLSACSTFRKIGWPMERARSFFETPARFGRATLNGLTPPRPLGATEWRPFPRQPLFLFPQLDS